MGSTAIASGDPPSGSLQDPTIVPPSFSTRVTTCRMGSAEISSLQSSASRPFVFGLALRDARLRFAAAFEGIRLSLSEIRCQTVEFPISYLFGSLEIGNSPL